MMTGSWRTTLAGIVVALAALFTAAGALLDSDPATNPNWTMVMAEVAAAGGLIAARDNGVSSESVGAK